MATRGFFLSELGVLLKSYICGIGLDLHQANGGLSIISVGLILKSSIP